MPFEGLAERTNQGLGRLIESVYGIAPIQTECWEFTVPEFDEGAADPEIVRVIRAWANAQYYLYYFELLEPQHIEDVERAFALAKAQGRDGRAYSRLNERAPMLYVGGSASIATRFKQHLGFGARKTYSLHLAHWAAALEVRLRFCCAGYGAQDDPEVFQTLEDQLWEESAPMFGRKGRR